MYTYKCNKCNRELNKDKFHKDSSCSKGHHSICIECRKKDRNILSELVSNAKYRAKKKNYNFNISKKYIKLLKKKQNNKCALSGRKMKWCPGKDPHSVSIDRIDSNKGYVKQNVQLVCIYVNKVKSHYNNEEFIKLCKDIVQHSG